MILVDGVPSDTVNVNNRALHYGDGLFETVLCMNNSFILWEYHIARLLKGCVTLEITPPEVETLFDEAMQCATAIRQPCIIKIILSRVSDRRGYAYSNSCSIQRVIQSNEYIIPSKSQRSNGLNTITCRMTCSDNYRLAGIKHLNRLEQVLAANEVAAVNADEGIMKNCAGRIVGGTKSNLFIISNGQLMTPKITSCGILGTLRAFLIEQLPIEDISIQIKDIYKEDVMQAEALLMTNSVVGLSKVSELDGHHYNDSPFQNELIHHFNRKLGYIDE